MAACNVCVCNVCVCNMCLNVYVCVMCLSVRPQSQICDSAKQILELSFAPLAHPDPCTPPETSRSEMSLSSSGAGLRGGSKDDGATHHRSRSERETWRRSILKDGFRKATSVPALHSSPRWVRVLVQVHGFSPGSGPGPCSGPGLGLGPGPLTLFESPLSQC